MNLREKSGTNRSLDVGKRVVLVAVKASRDISRSAFIWALTHVVQPGDSVKLLVLIPPHSSSKRLWGFPRFNSDCTTSNWRSLSGTTLDQKDFITESCTQMLLQLHDIYDPDKIKVKVKVISGSQSGVVAVEARRVQTRWVVLDKRMKKEARICMEQQLDCSIVQMKNSQPKVLRLNFIGSPNTDTELSRRSRASSKHLGEKSDDPWNEIRVPNVTPASSPEHSSFTTTDAGTSSISSLDLGASPLFFTEINWDMKKSFSHKCNHYSDESDSDTDSEKLSSPTTSICSHQWMQDILIAAKEYSSFLKKDSPRSKGTLLKLKHDVTPEKSFGRDQDPGVRLKKERHDLEGNNNMRKMMSLTKNSPADPPPLCSICQHKAPVFGKPPRWFTYSELERATGGFSQANFLAEGGYGSVHRGHLPDGQVIAVKQHKSASSQGDLEFCSEVEVLSCAQHRNVVMLIGFCVEDGRRLLVYEYICNGSLDSHLYGRNGHPLNWPARQKIAVGAARGLRYLHEECRVGCIVHRDLRPNNILLTHDFEPLVGDFGLARWQPEGDLGVDTRVIGTFGYLAPEYAQSGQITEKADVYSFGVVLLELVTGRKAIDINRPKGQQSLSTSSAAKECHLCTHRPMSRGLLLGAGDSWHATLCFIMHSTGPSFKAEDVPGTSDVRRRRVSELTL
ncbi:PREDICTED: inactive protein kinase SELMODRAFT_444075-like isoform X2 [Nicotiana attenuata]|uniref:inactive protein kinase SELMODRAFT_444075-like isoform X2 n=1 Tax=Nicotiana attenuata TaxID=49451 RepID=UPI000905A954|nr:PREDICTED: inactive protein kinase SELMODRAFT_444075-like isoform X2 [Nicotiana attenuata]